MPVRGQGIVDEVNVVAGDQRVIAVGDMLDAVLCGKGCGACGIAGGDRHDAAIGSLARGFEDGFGRNLRRPKDTDPDHAHPLFKTLIWPPERAS